MICLVLREDHYEKLWPLYAGQQEIKDALNVKHMIDFSVCSAVTCGPARETI